MLSTAVIAQQLTRRASWEASITYENGLGAKVISLPEDSKLMKAGVKTGDIVLKVNDIHIVSGETWTTATYSLRESEETTLLIRRGTATFSVSVMLNPLPLEKHVNHDTYYEQVTSDYGIAHRVIITKPKGVDEPLPAIFLIQGLSCSSIETYPGRTGNWPETIKTVVEQSGMVVMRVEKPGVGDSEGDCAYADFHMEIEGYRAAVRFLKSKSYVDTTKIVVYGSSMGSALAPKLANEFGAAGVISDGTFFKTWYEHMLEIERRIRQMQGDDESVIVKKMNEIYIPLYYGMLIEKKSYREILDQYPAMKDHMYHSPNHMYGRPMKYYHQLQDMDLAGEWEKIKVPVRILYGSNDWIMSEFDNHMIIKVLDKNGHEDHQLLIYPGLDHWNTIHEKPEDSFFGKPGQWDPQTAKTIVDWAKGMVE